MTYRDTCETCYERDPDAAPAHYTATPYLVRPSGNTLHAEFRHECGTWWWNEFPFPAPQTKPEGTDQ